MQRHLRLYQGHENHIRVEKTHTKGRGVFACIAIPPGMLIEEAHVIEIPPEQVEHIKATPLYNYFFKWPGNGAAIALGYASLYNHSYKPNARYVKKVSQRTIAFYAITRIHPGEEITVNYNGDPHDQNPIWFEANS